MAISEKFNALMPTTMSELIEFAERVSKSALIPKEYIGKPGDILVAMSMGMEVGLKPLQALQSIAVINGRPSLWGDGVRGLIMASGQVQSIVETDPKDVMTEKRARCEIYRKGLPDSFVGEFSMDDAHRAGLEGKDNYRKYPVNMLAWRAFHQAARKAFPDIYRGLAAAEEILEAESFRSGTGTVTVELDPAPPIAAPLAIASATEADGEQQERKRRGRPPKPTTATPASCGFCGEVGHAFNDCPQNQSVVEQDEVVVVEAASESDRGGTPIAPSSPAPSNGDEKADASQRRTLMKTARDLMGSEEGPRWIAGRIAALGLKTGADLTIAQFAQLDDELEEFRRSRLDTTAVEGFE